MTTTKIATCQCCGAKDFTANMQKSTLYRRGNANAYMCNTCATENRYYHATNEKVNGKAKVNKVYCGIEFETSYSDEVARNEMFAYGFIPTHDGSLNSDGEGERYGLDENACEYVSALMQGLNQASKFCLTAEKLIKSEHMKINNSCGTHFHVSIDSMKDVYGNKTYIGYIRRFYHSLFTPLSNTMQANPEKTEKLFGRYFEYTFAKPVNEYSDPDDRYLFINVTNNSNIEFRLNKFINGKQYQNLMKMEVEMVKTIVTNFCEHFNDEPTDSRRRRYPTKTAYRKHKAEVTANKLVKLYEKYANM